MGLIKDLGKIAGTIAGITVGAPVALVGEIVNSDFIREIGESAYKVTEHTGELLGNVAEGITETVYGTATSDKAIQSQGLSKVIDSSTSYAKGVARGTMKMITNGFNATDAILSGNTDEAIRLGKEIAKTVAVGTLAIGITNVLDGLDTIDGTDNSFTDNDSFVENINMHHVTPHVRTLSDGRTIWVDGDGNTGIDTFDGWFQTNPDYKA